MCMLLETFVSISMNKLMQIISLYACIMFSFKDLELYAIDYTLKIVGSILNLN